MDTKNRGDAAALLRHILCSSHELALGEERFRSLYQLYFREGGDAHLSEIELMISSDQLRTAIRGFLSQGFAQPNALPKAEADAGTAAILKDSAALEIELSGRVAERLMKWAKIFGVFVAVPVAIVVAVLAWFGISSVSDMRAAASKAEGLVTSATADLAKISKLQGDVRTQLTQLENASRSNLQKIAQLECRTRVIERNLGARTALLMGGKLDPGIVSKGGISDQPEEKQYGPFALNSRAAGIVATADTAPWRGEFDGKKPGDIAFDSAWRAVAQSFRENFFEAQRAFIKATTFDPSVAEILEREQLDLTKRSSELQEVVFAWTSLAGPGSQVLHQAAEEMRKAGTWNPDDPGFDAELLRWYYQKLQETKFYKENPLAFARLKTVMSASEQPRGDNCA